MKPLVDQALEAVKNKTAAPLRAVLNVLILRKPLTDAQIRRVASMKGFPVEIRERTRPKRKPFAAEEPLSCYWADPVLAARFVMDHQSEFWKAVRGRGTNGTR